MSMDKNTKLGIALTLVIVASVFVTFNYDRLFPQDVSSTQTYQTDLIAQFQLFDSTAMTSLTSNVLPEFYPDGTNPLIFGFLTSPSVVGSYDSTLAAWKAVLAKGSFEVLVKDTAGSKTKYPTLVGVVVPGTDNSDHKVVLSPYQITMVRRATVGISRAVYAYNVTSGAYDISVGSTINSTLYDNWRVHLEFTVGGSNYYSKAGRLYLSEHTSLSIISQSIDGAVPGGMLKDSDASGDSLTGWYTTTGTWMGGEVHYADLYLQDTALVTAGTMTVTLADYYECQNSALKWWTFNTAAITIAN